MYKMIAIACLDAKNGIGKNGQLLISIPDDMKFFRETTKGEIVVMGRKTLFSFKDKAPLKNRINIVFTTDNSLKDNYKDYDNIFFVKNKTELNEIIKDYKGKKVFVIGGAKIYNYLINDCDTALITRVNKTFDADTYFPDLSTNNFRIYNESETYTYEGIEYKFVTYKKDI